MLTPRDRINKEYRRSQVGRHTIYFRLTDYGIVLVCALHDQMSFVKLELLPKVSKFIST